MLNTPFAPMRKLAAVSAALAIGLVGTLFGGALSATADDTPIVHESSDFEWSYLDDGTDPAAGAENPDAWAATDFDDSAWKKGKGSFGAKLGKRQHLKGGYLPNTLLSQYLPNTDKENVPAFFFRSTLNLSKEEASAIESVTAEVIYDDAVSLFVNGTYVGGGHDDDLKADPARNTVYGGSNESKPIKATIEIPADALVAGENVLGMRVNNGRVDSSDVYVDFERITIKTGAAEPTWEDVLRESSISNVILGVGATEDSRNLVWYTDDDHSKAPVVELIEASKLQDGAFPESGATVFTSEQISTERALQGASRGFEANVNKVVFSGLAADTSYAYRIGDGEEWLGQWTFTTETGGDNWSFFFTGDPQIGAAAGHKGANPMERHWTADTWGWNETMKVATETYPNIRTHVSAGDQVESTKTPEPNNVANMTEVQYLGYSYPEALKTLQNAPTVGNHDFYTGGRDTYQQHYNLANFDTEVWDSWWGQGNILFLHLNTEFADPETDFAKHDAWLTKVLAEQGDKYDFHVVVMHRPPYSAGKHSVTEATDNVRKTFVPLLNKHSIDALLTGHDHTYARSHIVDNFYPGTPEKNWSDATGEVIDLGSGADAPSEVFLTGNQMVSIVANSASGSKYYDLKDVGHPYIAVKNQDYMRTYTVVDVDSCSLTYRTHRAETYGELEQNSIVDEVRVNLADAAPTLQKPEAITVDQSEVADLDLVEGLEYTVCDEERFPVEVEGTVDPEKLDTPQTITYRIAAGTAWEVTAEREVTVQKAEPAPTDPTEDPTGEPTVTDPTDSTPSADGAKTDAGSLARTGVDVMLVLFAAAGALVIGILLVRVRARANEDM